MNRIVIAVVVVLLPLGCASGSTRLDPSWIAPAVPLEGTAEERSEHEFKRHLVAMIIRVVSEERAKGGAAIGLEYEYRLQQAWGIGGFAEYVAGEIQAGVFGAALTYHPTERWGIAVGPGYELSEEEDRWLFRAGTFYEFKAGEVTIAPAFYVDTLEGGGFALLGGLNFAVQF